MPDWFARPVFHVTDVEASLRFYVDHLSFTTPWRFDEDGKVFVAQVERQGCAIILSSQWPEKIGKGLLFISLNVEPPTPEAATAALDELRAEASSCFRLSSSAETRVPPAVIDTREYSQRRCVDSL